MTYGHTVWARFWKYVPKDRAAHVCWEWRASLDKRGYGQLADKPNRTVLKAHRLAFEAAYGPVPQGLFVLHKCGNASCVNPAHLYAGDAADNFRDMIAHGTHKAPPHHLGEKSGRAILTEKQVRAIKRSRATGVALAAKFGVAQSTVSAIRHGKFWRHVE